LQLKNSIYHSIRETRVQGRYLNLDHIEGILKKRGARFPLTSVGHSVNGENLYRIMVGEGPVNVMMWSQMHGNESTTTKAVLDLLSYLDSSRAANLVSGLQLCILPMLNPDGARAYTRLNARGIDLNRDAIDLSQPESKALRAVYDDFKPHFCFNLHDQRTLYNVGDSPLPATLSFLAPASDKHRTVTGVRAKGMKLIAAIDKALQELIPGQVGRYDDTFNPNCVGDSFQALNTTTLLFEAGHFPGDYEREVTRGYVFLAMLSALRVISAGTIDEHEVEGYFNIPENGKCFWDIIIENPHHINRQWEKGIKLGLQYQEVLEDGRIRFRPKLEEAGLLKGKYGHTVYDCSVSEQYDKVAENKELLDLLN
jgi:hypothetical protein